MADVFGSLVTYGLNTAAQERAFAQQKELQNDAQNYNTLMWNKNNQYNSAVSQMQRFKDAGLNPNLIYGQMQGAGAAPSISAGSAPAAAQAAPVSALETAQLALINSQKRNIDADTDNKNADTGVKEANANLLTTQEFVAKEDLRIRQELKDKQIEVDDATIANINESTKKLTEEIANVKADTALKNLEHNFLDKSFDDRVELIKAQVRNYDSSTNLNNAQAARIVTLLDQELSNLQAAFDEISSRTNLNNQQIENLKQQKLIEAVDNVYLLAANEHFGKGQNVRGNMDMLRHLIGHVLRFNLK